MPSGYTADLYEGKDVTFPEFAMKCARAFGALIEMKEDPLDAPIPEGFEPISYYQRNLVRARADLAAYEARSDAEWDAAAQVGNDEAYRSVVESNADSRAKRSRYEAMLAQVRDWEPPTDEHRELKGFMEKQLQDSLEFDCHVLGLPAPLTGAEFKAQSIASVRSSVAYYEREAELEQARINGRNEWLRALRESLPAPAAAS